MTDPHVNPTTTDAGIPVESDEHSLTVGPDGPILLQDHYLIEQMAKFNRERIPERQPHAKGGGAFGHFEVTNDVSQYTRAAVFQPGTTTDTLIRFSTVAGERGSPDTWRDPRGFALKFYTTEGNFDMVGNNTPVFFIRDPLKFQHFIRSQKRRADNNLRDNDMQWDFWTLSPESAHQVTWLMGDRGIPRTWRHMNGYSSHTYSWINAAGEKFWVKYHFITDQGIEFLTQDEADQMAGADGDYHQRDLYEAIERGDYPSWTLKMQIMPFEEAKTYRFNPFDLTKVWPHGDYPLIEVGKLTLDRNLTDYHTEIEQAAFEPNNLVPGIGLSARTRCCWPAGSPTPTPTAPGWGSTTSRSRSTRRKVAGAQLQQGRRDADHQRLRPGVRAQLQGRPAGRHRRAPPRRCWHADGDMVRAAYTLHAEDDDWGQAGTMVREVLDDAARERLVHNIVGHLLNGVTEPVLQRAFEYWRNVDKNLGDKVEAGVRAKQGEKDPKAAEQANPARSSMQAKA